MANSFLSIGEFAKLCHTTKHTLYHYADIGLFSPSYTDENGYRYYHVLQYDLFLTIQHLHRSGMSLRSIKEYLTDRNPRKIVDLYQKQEQQIIQQMQQLEQIRKNLHSSATQILDAIACEMDAPYIDKLPERKIICSRPVANNSDSEMTQEVSKLIAALYNNSQSSVLGMTCNFEEALSGCECSYRFYAYVKEDMGLLTVIEEGDYACLYHKGDYETLEKSYGNLKSWATNNNYTLAADVFVEIVIGDWAVESSDDYVFKIFSRIIK